MPTVLRAGPYRVLFYSREPAGEPPHVHVKRDGAEAKIWLEPASLSWNEGFPARELGPILSLVREHRSALLEAYHAYLGPTRPR